MVNYKKSQDEWLKVTGIELGSKVKAVVPYTREQYQPLHVTDTSAVESPKFVGRVGVVGKIYDFGIEVHYGRYLTDDWSTYNLFPYWCLVKVEDEEL